MAFERKSAIVSIALLVMVVALTVSEVDGRLLDNQSNQRGVKTDERRNLMNIVGVGSKTCCNKVITTCCAPAPAPKPTTKASKTTPSKDSKPKASSPKAPAPKASFFKSLPPMKSLFKSPKAAAPKSSKAPAPKTSTPKSPKTSTPKSPKAAPVPKL